MNITPTYLEDFAVSAVEKPKEVKLSSWESDAEASIGLDDPEGRALAVRYWDEWPADKQWKIRKGTDKRWTFVTIQKDGVDVEEHGYEFAGLVRLDDLRAWFRKKLEIKE